MEVDRPSDVDRMLEAVRDELHVQNGIMGLQLENAAVDNLAAVVGSRIDYGFTVEWAPKWVKAGDPHRWQEADQSSPSGEWHFRECLVCGRMTRHTSGDEADADYTSHYGDRHGHSEGTDRPA